VSHFDAALACLYAGDGPGFVALAEEGPAYADAPSERGAGAAAQSRAFVDLLRRLVAAGVELPGLRDGIAMLDARARGWPPAPGTSGTAATPGAAAPHPGPVAPAARVADGVPTAAPPFAPAPAAPPAAGLTGSAGVAAAVGVAPRVGEVPGVDSHAPATTPEPSDVRVDENVQFTVYRPRP
jgi:hypothetical protein